MNNPQYPPEILLAICAFIHTCSIPTGPSPSLDPLVSQDDRNAPIALPSSHPSSSWPESVARQTLARLCLVNHAWYDAAKPWLWDKLQVRLPRTFLSMVEQVAWDYDEETVDMVMDHTIRAATQAALAATSPGELDAKALEDRIVLCLNAPDESIPLELLSPVASREPSPRRIRPTSKSPARWKIVRNISDAVQGLLELNEPGLYIPTPNDPRPGRFVRHLDFNHFRTVNMRRSVGEGVNSPFVTPYRVEALIKEMPNLLVFGATEFMDSSLNLRILNELFLRGTPSRGRGQPTRGRALIDPANEMDEEDRERRRDCRELIAVDFTGCISSVFVRALDDFAAAHLLSSEGSRGRMSTEPLRFPGLQRLGMRAVKSVCSQTLSAFVLAFPSLTHLDLSGTRVDDELLRGLSQSRTIHLHSLALARCVKITGSAIVHLLLYSQATCDLRELNLYGDMTYSSPLTEEDLDALFEEAPCFISEKLVYLDLSSSPLTTSLLAKMPKQPALRSLGLSHIPLLGLKVISEFLRDKAKNVEVLTLASTSPELCAAGGGGGRGARQASIALHTHVIRPICMPPFSFSVSPAAAGAPKPSALTRLRVIELAPAMLNALWAGAESWRIIRSKGGRGWYVDTASGWIDGKLRRDLDSDHPWRRHLEQLSDANGNVSSGVGWHARKMEIMHGHGMLGHEDGLYGAVSFAYYG